MTPINRGVIFAGFLVPILILVSCAVASPPKPSATPTQEPQPTETRTAKLTLTSGGTEDDGFPLGATIGAAVTETVPNMEMSVKNTSSMMENMKLLLNGQVDMAFGYDYYVALANQGHLALAFPDAPTETIRIKCGVEVVRPAFPDYSQPVRVIIPLYEQPLHLVTAAAGEISGISDLKGKRISIGLPGSISAELATYLLKALAIDLEQDITLEHLSVTESATALKKGEIDGFFWDGPVPNPDIASIFAESSIKMVLIPIAGDEAAQVMRAYPNIFHKSRILAHSYPNLNADVATLAVTLVLTAMEDLPDEQVTQIVSALFESKQEGLSTLHISINHELAISQLGSEAQPYLHKGSAAYFEK